jgi:8-oxo-dGTP pyrophosphatase MutT (NUDIX family)
MSRVVEVLSRPAVRNEHPTVPRAAVAVVITDALELLFIRRAIIAGDPWSGHIAFPGGKQEPNEDLVETSIRETMEEIGLVLEPSLHLGELDENTSPKVVSRLVVRPHVFRIDALPSLTLSAQEVDGVHVVPLARLLEDKGRSSFQLAYGGNDWTLPFVDLDGDRLWGMTLRMVDDLLDRIDGRGTGLDRLG